MMARDPVAYRRRGRLGAILVAGLEWAPRKRPELGVLAAQLAAL